VRWFNPEGLMTAAEIAEGFADYLIRGLLAKPEAYRATPSARGIRHIVYDPASRTALRRASAGSIAEGR